MKKPETRLQSYIPCVTRQLQNRYSCGDRRKVNDGLKCDILYGYAVADEGLLIQLKNTLLGGIVFLLRNGARFHETPKLLEFLA